MDFDFWPEFSHFLSLAASRMVLGSPLSPIHWGLWAFFVRVKAAGE
jgi:hypothetical protein